MIDVPKVSQGEQYCLIGLSILLINKIYQEPIEKYNYKHFINLALITLVLILSVWVSDLAVVTIFIILFIYILLFLKNNNWKIYFGILKKPEFYYIISGLIFGTLFIYYAKSNAVVESNYYDFFNIKIFVDSFLIFKGTIVDLLIFKANEPFTSLYLYLIIALLSFVFLKNNIIKYDKNNLKWFFIFIIDLIAIFIIILSSKWAYMNGVPRRYFICNYISFWIVFLITIESIQSINYKNILMYLLLSTAIIGGVGTIYTFKYIWPKTLRPMVDVVGEIKQLGNIGIIAEYWNSYIISCIDPVRIKATPNDQSLVRKPELVNEVFKQDRIFLIKDMWLKSFPDTIIQFNHKLKRKGSEFFLGNCCLNEYVIVNKK